MSQFNGDVIQLCQAENIPTLTLARKVSNEFEPYIDGDMSTTKLNAVKVEI